MNRVLGLMMTFTLAFSICGCGTDWKQAYQDCNRQNAALSVQSKNLQTQVRQLDAQLQANDQAIRMTEAKAQGDMAALIEAGERAAALAPVCDSMPWLCTKAQHRIADAALKAGYPPAPRIAALWIATIFGLTALAAGVSLLILGLIYMRLIEPRAARLSVARSFIREAQRQHTAYEHEQTVLSEQISQSKAELAHQIVEREKVRQEVAALTTRRTTLQSDVAALEAETLRLQRDLDTFRGL